MGWMDAADNTGGVFRCLKNPVSKKKRCLKNPSQNPNFSSHLHHIETLNIANDPCIEY
jgi:hypothetical protein